MQTIHVMFQFQTSIQATYFKFQIFKYFAESLWNKEQSEKEKREE